MRSYMHTMAEYCKPKSRGDAGVCRDEAKAAARVISYFAPSDGHRKVLVPDRVEREFLGAGLIGNLEALGPLLPVGQVPEDGR